MTKCSPPNLALTINTLNRIADPGFTYDAAGNLIAEPQKTYQYDAENRMTQSVVSGVTATYAYDGENIVEETDASGAVVARYTQGLNIDERLAMLCAFCAKGVQNSTNCPEKSRASFAS